MPHEKILGKTENPQRNSDNALDHENWLVGMKMRYIENKQALKDISKEYRKDGIWLMPEPQKQ